MAPSQNNNDLAVTDSQPLPAQQGATPATTTAPAPGDLSVVKSEPAPGPTWLDSVGDYAKGVWSQINPVSAVKGVAQAVSHPIDTATQMLQNQGALADKAKTAFQSGDYVTGLRHSLDYLLPVIGPSIDAMGDKAQAGKPAEALGEATGFAVPAALGARSVALPAAPADLTKAAAKTATATNSLAFWLTARRHGLAGNGQYCGKAALSSLPGLPVGLPKSPLPGLSGCASQSLRRGVRFWLTEAGGLGIDERPHCHWF